MLLNNVLRCQACGVENILSARFCNQCSAPLVSPRMLPPDAERKQVSILFSDMTGFTALTEGLDPEETRRIMGQIFGHATEIVRRYGGRIEKFIGDAVMAIFGVPLAREDDPARAVRAALELHEAIARLSAGLELPDGTSLAMHSGVNTGLVVTGELQFDGVIAGPLGETINIAARLMSGAPAGEIWIGPETRRLIGSAFETENLGPREFKGKALPIEVSRVIRAMSRCRSPSHHRATYIGRLAELGTLLGAAEKMRAGQAQRFGVCGDPGSGKTRLVAELRARLGSQVRWLEGCAYAFSQQTPYATLIDLFSRLWTIEEVDGPTQVRAKLIKGIGDVLGEDSQTASLLFHLYNLSQDVGVVIEREAFQDQLLAAMKRLLSAIRRGAPVVLCLQDLHWADPSTLNLLERLCGDLHEPVLLLGNYRPGYKPPTGMQELVLNELSPGQTKDLLASLLDTSAPEELARFIVGRCDGNPFYIEEVMNSLIEEEVLVPTSEGWALTRPLVESSVPSTIRGVIAARIDRLDETRRRVLRHAAVVGREFLYSIVAQVTDADNLSLCLEDLQAVDLICARRLDPELEYIFKHALTQEVAYDGLLRTERQLLHARAARAIELVMADRLPEFVETLAYHYQRGGVPDKAVPYLVEAGRKCVARYALVEAEVHFRRAYELVAAGEPTQTRYRALAELLASWSQVHYYNGTIGEWRRLLEQHTDDVERCGEPALQAIYQGWLGNARSFSGDFPGSLQALDRAVALGRSAKADDATSHAMAWRAFTECELGRIADGIQSAESVKQSPQEILASPYPFLKSQGALAVALAWKGDLRRSRSIAESLIEFGRSSGNARALSLGHFSLGIHWLLALDFQRAAAASKAGVDAAKDPLFRVANALIQSLALAADMRIDEAQEVCQAWQPYLQRNENRWFGLMMSQVRASTDLAHGDLSSGFRALLAGLDACRARQMVSITSLAEVFLALTYVSISRMDIKPSLVAVARNPWFVLTQAPFAASRAGNLIMRLRGELKEKDLSGMRGLVDLAEARLIGHQGRKSEAREVIQRIRKSLEDADVDPNPAPVKAIFAEVAPV